MTDALDFVPRRSARVASQKRDAPEPIAKPTTTAKSQNGATKKAKTEPAPKKIETKVTTLDIGDDLPEIVLKDQDDNDVNLATEAKSSTIVIFCKSPDYSSLTYYASNTLILAYPRASTPGCTTVCYCNLQCT